MKILFIGDIMGRIGRQAVAKILPKLKKELKLDLVIANAENSAHGSGVTEDIIKELGSIGINWFTAGDHAFSNKKNLFIYDEYPIIRPANFPPQVPGNGHALITINNKKILLINLIGRVFMKSDYDCPFRKIDEILANNNLPENNLFAIIIDIHAEATSEKQALFHYLDGKVNAIFGTHTHIMTADPQISKKGTAYITDTGMVGFASGCLGLEKEGIIKTFLTQIKNQHVLPEKGQTIFNAVLLELDAKGKTKKIKPIIKYINIK